MPLHGDIDMARLHWCSGHRQVAVHRHWIRRMQSVRDRFGEYSEVAHFWIVGRKPVHGAEVRLGKDDKPEAAPKRFEGIAEDL